MRRTAHPLWTYCRNATRYVADTGSFVEHDVGPSFWILPWPMLEILASGDYITGRDLHVLLVQTSVAYRPRL